ncbi:MAG: hypothetical protein COB37_01570 [Kordiimonadales bacterium]|nr:MAG: hypothetical protein COB37_01570 [Kordiimonadales bacterium]
MSPAVSSRTNIKLPELDGESYLHGEVTPAHARHSAKQVVKKKLLLVGGLRKQGLLLPRRTALKLPALIKAPLPPRPTLN